MCLKKLFFHNSSKLQQQCILNDFVYLFTFATYISTTTFYIPNTVGCLCCKSLNAVWLGYHSPQGVLEMSRLFPQEPQLLLLYNIRLPTPQLSSRCHSLPSWLLYGNKHHNSLVLVACRPAWRVCFFQFYIDSNHIRHLYVICVVSRAFMDGLTHLVCTWHDFKDICLRLTTRIMLSIGLMSSWIRLQTKPDELSYDIMQRMWAIYIQNTLCTSIHKIHSWKTKMINW